MICVCANCLFFGRAEISVVFNLMTVAVTLLHKLLCHDYWHTWLVNEALSQISEHS